MKKLISLLLCGLMLFGTIIPVSATSIEYTEAEMTEQDDLWTVISSDLWCTESTMVMLQGNIAVQTAPITVKFDKGVYWGNKYFCPITMASKENIIYTESESDGSNNSNKISGANAGSVKSYEVTRTNYTWKKEWISISDNASYEMYGSIEIITPVEEKTIPTTKIPIGQEHLDWDGTVQLFNGSFNDNISDHTVSINLYTENTLKSTDVNGLNDLDKEWIIAYKVILCKRTRNHTCIKLQVPILSLTYNYSKFSDISAQAWYAPVIGAAHEIGILKGVKNDSMGHPVMNPQGQLTLAQAITMTARIYETMSGITIPAKEDNEAWYAPYVKYAEYHALLPFDELRNVDNMNKLITRAQFASIVAMLPRLEGQSGGAEYRISDVASTNKYYSSIQQLYYRGITQGSGTQKRDIGLYSIFYPNKTLTRAEAAAMLCRTLYASMQKDNTQFKET